MQIKNTDLHCLKTAFLSDNIEQTEEYLGKLNITTKNSDGTYKPFNEVMDQICALSVEQGEYMEVKTTMQFLEDVKSFLYSQYPEEYEFETKRYIALPPQFSPFN